MIYGGNLKDYNRQARNSVLETDFAELERRLMAYVPVCEVCGHPDRLYNGWDAEMKQHVDDPCDDCTHWRARLA